MTSQLSTTQNSEAIESPIVDLPDAGVRVVVASAGKPFDIAERRRGEPLTLGVPLPRGRQWDPQLLSLFDAEGVVLPMQCGVLDRWPDGSIRWLLVDLKADVDGQAATEYRLRVVPTPTRPRPDVRLTVVETKAGVEVETGRARFRMRVGGRFPFEQVLVQGIPAIDVSGTTLLVEAAKGSALEPRIAEVFVEEQGDLRTVVVLKGSIASPGGEILLELTTRLHFFAGSATVRFVLTLTNPRRAKHRGGYWMLGDEGSVYLKDVSFVLTLSEGERTVECSPQLGSGLRPHACPVELYQDSSGGENWRSSNHVNRHGHVPLTLSGYRLISKDVAQAGARATPLIWLKGAGQEVGIAIEHFWQNFPKALEATTDSLTLRLFPRQYADVHEIQGGEQKTHTFFVAFDADEVTETGLAWCRSPLIARCDPTWYSDTGVVPYLMPAAEDRNPEYLQLVTAAIEGDDTFERKREVIDEFGWRHFGDIYADHESVFYRGPGRPVSHYNNQYDAMAGFAYQFLRTGDVRWWTLMNELAAHVVDIDVYHTDRDKAGFNRGLFWHTAHYTDAGTSTHRSHPRASGIQGGGPSAEHNYTTGLALHHFLTGNPLSREVAIDLARWVINMDDGRRTILRWVCRSATGWASATGSLAYHGPGRGAGHSINALLDGHRLSGDRIFLDKAEELIRRCVHPNDVVEELNLLDAERRWSYIVFLQVLGRYLVFKRDLGQLDRMYAYARESLLRYARWMAVHEYPYLNKPEILEFPTETWAAQDMRKSEVFKWAASHATGEARGRFLERSEFFFRQSTATLLGADSRTLARPMVLLLSNGFMHAYFQQNPGTAVPSPPSIADFGSPRRFVPQRVRAKRRAVAAAIGAALAAAAVIVLTV